MKHRAIFRALLAVLAIFFVTDLLASAETDFEQGVKAFKSGNNEAAVRYFESAMEQGMDTVSLRYNLASSYYKAERYEAARSQFLTLLEVDAMYDLASYNLGLIATKQKEWDRARQYFSDVIKSDRDEKLSRLSEKQLARLTGEDKRFSANLFANLGYDDNIVSVSDGSALNKADTLYDVYASGNYLISGKHKDGWIADASLYYLGYSDNSEYNLGLFWGGLKKTFELGGWSSGAHLKLYKSTYGGDDYLTSGMVDLTGSRKLSASDGIYLRYRYEDIRSDHERYDYLAGWRQRVNAEYRRFTRDSLLQLIYELELNSRGELITTDYSYEYSPTRHTLRGKYAHRIHNWRLGGDVAYRDSSFPASETIDRKDQQWVLALFADYHFDKTFKLTSKVQYIDNQSTEDRYIYNKSIIKFGISKSF